VKCLCHVEWCPLYQMGYDSHVTVLCPSLPLRPWYWSVITTDCMDHQTFILASVAWFRPQVALFFNCFSPWLHLSVASACLMSTLPHGARWQRRDFTWALSPEFIVSLSCCHLAAQSGETPGVMRWPQLAYLMSQTTREVSRAWKVRTRFVTVDRIGH